MLRLTGEKADGWLPSLGGWAVPWDAGRLLLFRRKPIFPFTSSFQAVPPMQIEFKRGVLPALLAAALMGLTGCISARLARRSVDLSVLVAIVPAQAAQDRGELVATRDSRPDGSNLQYSTPQPRTDTASTGTVTTQARLIDDNAIEYLQVALGALGGVAIVGGLVAGRSVRHRGHTQPA